MEAAAAAVAAVAVWPTAITRRNIKQQDNVNEQTSMLLLGIIVIESAHKHTLQNIAVFSGTPHARNNNALNKIKKTKGKYQLNNKKWNNSQQIAHKQRKH